MRIEEDIKLDFKDVLIRPKRSTLKSRAQVDLEREYAFVHTHLKWKGVPIIAANMDHTGTFAVAKILTQHKLMTAVHKFTIPKEWVEFEKASPSSLLFTFVSSGIRDKDIAHLNTILQVVSCPFICMDVANGYTQFFVDAVKKVRALYPEKIIMAGNVVTGEMTEELILSGADIVKVGIGPGSV